MLIALYVTVQIVVYNVSKIFFEILRLHNVNFLVLLLVIKQNKILVQTVLIFVKTVIALVNAPNACHLINSIMLLAIDYAKIIILITMKFKEYVLLVRFLIAHSAMKKTNAVIAQINITQVILPRHVKEFVHSPLNQSCIICMQYCSDCDNATTCNQCIGGYSFNAVAGQCLKKCSDGNFYNNNTSTCVVCQAPCATCIVSPTQCQSCSNQLVLNGTTCISNPCSGATFWDNSQVSCSNCSKGCTLCSNNQTCNKCDGNYQMNYTSNQCSIVCGIGQINVQGICMNCPSNCAVCLNMVICSTCSANYAWNSQTISCDCTCKNGYYCDNKAQSCTQCPQGCQTCTTPTNCLSCSLNYVQTAQGVCSLYPCQNGFMYDESLNKCSGIKCLMSNCRACTSKTNCIDCNNQYVLQDNNCIPILNLCPPAQFWNTSKSQYQCTPCMAYCEICNNQTSCQNNSCQSPASQDQKTLACIPPQQALQSNRLLLNQFLLLFTILMTKLYLY